MDYYTIKKFSELINKSPGTLRNFDQSDYFKPKYKGKNGYRYYSHDQLLTLKQTDSDIQLGVIQEGDNQDLIETYLANSGTPYKLIKSETNCYKLLEVILKELQRYNINRVVLYSNENFKDDMKILIKTIVLSFNASIEYIKQN